MVKGIGLTCPRKLPKTGRNKKVVSRSLRRNRGVLDASYFEVPMNQSGPHIVLES